MFKTIKIWFWYIFSVVHNFFTQLLSLRGERVAPVKQEDLQTISESLSGETQNQFYEYLQSLLKKYYLQPMEIDKNEAVFLARCKGRVSCWGEEIKLHGYHILRHLHGVPHAVRTWYLARELDAKLKDLLNDPLRLIAAKAFNVNLDEVTEDQIDILSIAPLLHDSGRQACGPDHWDHLSGENISLELLKKGISPVWAYILGKYAELKDEPNAADKIVSGELTYKEQQNIELFPYSKEYDDVFTDEVKKEAVQLLKEMSDELSQALAYFSHRIGFADLFEIRRCVVFNPVTSLNDTIAQRGEAFYDQHPKQQEICNVLSEVGEFSSLLLEITGDLKKKEGPRDKYDTNRVYDLECSKNAPKYITEKGNLLKKNHPALSSKG